MLTNSEWAKIARAIARREGKETRHGSKGETRGLYETFKAEWTTVRETVCTIERGKEWVSLKTWCIDE